MCTTCFLYQDAKQIYDIGPTQFTAMKLCKKQKKSEQLIEMSSYIWNYLNKKIKNTAQLSCSNIIAYLYQPRNNLVHDGMILHCDTFQKLNTLSSQESTF